jgi:hypothetical protein
MGPLNASGDVVDFCLTTSNETVTKTIMRPRFVLYIPKPQIASEPITHVSDVAPVSLRPSL